MSSTGLSDSPLLQPAAALNPSLDEVLIAWNDEQGAVLTARVDLSTGQPVGFAIEISSGSATNAIGPAGILDLLFDPRTAFYYAVFQADDDGERIKLCRLSNVGSKVNCEFIFDDVSFDFDAFAYRPSVALNPVEDEILVAFRQHKTFAGKAPEFCMAVRDVPLSDFLAGGNGAVACLGEAANLEARPALAYNSIDNEYLMVWHDERVVGGVLQFQIFARRLDGTDGDPIPGSPEFRVSDAALADSDIDATFPDVVYNPELNEYLVVWTSDDTDAGLVDGEQEIFAQRLSNTGVELGINDQRVSFVSGTGTAAWDAVEPKVDWNPSSRNYLLTWKADDEDFGLANNEAEVFVAILDGETATPRSGAVRVSDMGPDGDTGYQAQTPIAAVGENGMALIAWWGRDLLISPRVDVYGQRVEIPFFQDGFESGDTDNWSPP